MTRFVPISFASLLDVETMSPSERALAAKGIAAFTGELARCIAHYEGEQTPEASPEPVTESPVVEQPVTEAPVVEQPVTESPVVEQPVTEAPVVEQPVTEAPVVEQPAETVA